MADYFITLSSGNTTDESGSDPYASITDDSTPLSTPDSATHDTSLSQFHIQDLETFTQDLQNAANRAFPNTHQPPRYSHISVLLLRWEDDEMNVDWELEDLEKVFMKYGFDTERWLIPKRNPHLRLMSKVVDLVEEHDGKEDLVLVYYAGHAFINSQRQATWSCKSDPTYASLEWSAIQTLFEKAAFDVLLLLDCCAAASAAPTVGSAVTETIAACGFESIAPQPGRYSFTNTLIEVLEDWIDSPPFSAAMLHNKVLSVLKHERPERMQNGKRRRLECRKTPIHIVATADPRLPSIELGRRNKSVPENSTLEGSPAGEDCSNDVSENTSSTDVLTPKSLKRKAYEIDAIYEVKGDYYDVPRVIISLALEKHQTLSSDSCQKWLASCPTLVKYATIEAVYKSFSTLVLLSIPVMIWDLLPENPACSFVGYVTSSNLHRGISYQTTSEAFLALEEKVVAEDEDESSDSGTEKGDSVPVEKLRLLENPRCNEFQFVMWDPLISNETESESSSDEDFVDAVSGTSGHALEDNRLRGTSRKRRMLQGELDFLESEFNRNTKPSSDTKLRIAKELDVHLMIVNNWFQNKRAATWAASRTNAGEASQLDLVDLIDLDDSDVSRATTPGLALPESTKSIIGHGWQPILGTHENKRTIYESNALFQSTSHMMYPPVEYESTLGISPSNQYSSTQFGGIEQHALVAEYDNWDFDIEPALSHSVNSGLSFEELHSYPENLRKLSEPPQRKRQRPLSDDSAYYSTSSHAESSACASWSTAATSTLGTQFGSNTCRMKELSSTDPTGSKNSLHLPDEFSKLSDMHERRRRRIQNHQAQRAYRAKLKARLENLELRAGSRSASPPTVLTKDLDKVNYTPPTEPTATEIAVKDEEESKCPHFPYHAFSPPELCLPYSEDQLLVKNLEENWVNPSWSWSFVDFSPVRGSDSQVS